MAEESFLNGKLPNKREERESYYLKACVEIVHNDCLAIKGDKIL